MRALGLIGLVLALAIVGVLVKRQMGSMAGAPAADARPQLSQPQQALQVQQQFKQSLDEAMQQPRPIPDDAR
jgi:curli biogenesis system outer membrane secretion channel CsgG